MLVAKKENGAAVQPISRTDVISTRQWELPGIERSMTSVDSVASTATVWSKPELVTTSRKTYHLGSIRTFDGPIVSRYDRFDSWGPIDFYMTHLNNILFLDYYFRHIYVDIPLLSRTSMEAHMLDVPVHVLHAMYACCLQDSAPVGEAIPQRAVDHMKIAVKCVHKDLESTDPFSCMVLCHAAMFSLKAASMDWVGHVTLGVHIAIQLGINTDQPISWISPRGTRMASQDMCRGIWLLLYYLDFYGNYLFKLPMTI
ncbi:hypothetical protein HDU91_003021, partial [Kappamyces sp. JEL0680]